DLGVDQPPRRWALSRQRAGGLDDDRADADDPGGQRVPGEKDGGGIQGVTTLWIFDFDFRFWILDWRRGGRSVGPGATMAQPRDAIAKASQRNKKWPGRPGSCSFFQSAHARTPVPLFLCCVGYVFGCAEAR